MQDFEKLGAFYLGRSVTAGNGAKDGSLVLYDSRDLTTHAVIIGMTGSGKTGLGIALLEEAAMDRVPVIAIDPKGDLGNLMLSFPQLTAARLKPWANAREAERNGLSLDEYAREQAAMWRDGLKSWGQSAERIEKLRATAEFALYTPGSSAGIPVSVLQSFRRPAAEIQEDKDLYREKIAATATSILALMGKAADPVTSREHILISNVLEHAWDAGRDLDLAGLIGAIQNPPFARIGVMEIDSFYPPGDRLALAMKLNNLLASPGFEAWLEGEPLSARGLLFTESGKPKVSILSIAHLSDAERMFFVTMVLNELLGWMRTQPGTGSLRAVLYMDEIFGYMPPVGNPPSKFLLLTLLKQARAFGLGVVLSTQNPVDLDYKGLSNTGTWFIGRLQTEQDKERVMDGLAGAAGEGYDRKQIDRLLSGLGKRRFLLHNVHENQPILFETRWVMSYLAGPMSREQIKRLVRGRETPSARPPVQVAAAPLRARALPGVSPALPPGVESFYLPVFRHPADDAQLVYRPLLIGAAEVAWHSARYRIHHDRRLVLVTPVEDGPVAVDWDSAEELELDWESLSPSGVDGAVFDKLPVPAEQATNYREWDKLLKRWIRGKKTMVLYRSRAFRLTSTVEEDEGAFRARLQAVARERRDRQLEKLRAKYERRTTSLQNRLLRAEQALSREEEQASERKFDTAVAFGTALLDAFLGRKRVTRRTTGRFGSAIRKAGSIRKESADVERARETADAVRVELQELEQAFERDVEKIELQADPDENQLEEIAIRPKSTDIHVHFVGIAWAPFLRLPGAGVKPAWR